MQSSPIESSSPGDGEAALYDRLYPRIDRTCIDRLAQLAHQGETLGPVRIGRGVVDHDAPLARRLTRLASLATGVSMTANLCALEASALVFWSVFVLGTSILVALVCLRNYVARRVGEISARARLLPEIERLDYLASVQLARAERSRRRSRMRAPRQLESVPVTARCSVCGAGVGEWCDAGLHG